MTTGLSLQKLLYKPEGLAGLIEALGRLGRNLCTVLCNLQQLTLSGRVGALFGFFEGQQGITLSVQNSSVTADLDSLKESGAFLVIRIGAVDRIESSLGFCLDTFKTDGQYLFILYSEMTDTVVEVVARCEDIVLHGKQGFVCHVRGSQITGGLAFPVFVYLM